MRIELEQVDGVMAIVPRTIADEVAHRAPIMGGATTRDALRRESGRRLAALHRAFSDAGAERLA